MSISLKKHKRTKSPAVPPNLRWIGKRIQARRKKLGLTQEQLAEKLDVAVTTVQFIEQSRRLPSIQMLVALCGALNLALSLVSLKPPA